ncbi:MAG: hypothetical protein CM15mP70_00880 [Pelagibacteraceae bacterium]|nr:MAG: hypothetical protein CM15mP70_00880 [Pelagibacteraceae bacterium]
MWETHRPTKERILYDANPRVHSTTSLASDAGNPGAMEGDVRTAL